MALECARLSRDILAPTAWPTITRSCPSDEPGVREDLRGTHDIHTLIIGRVLRELTHSETDAREQKLFRGFMALSRRSA